MKITAMLVSVIIFLIVVLSYQHMQISVLSERNKRVASLNGQLVVDIKQATDTVADLYRQRSELDVIVQQQQKKVMALEVQRDDFYKQIRAIEKTDQAFKIWANQRINTTALRLLNCRLAGNCHSN